MRLTLDDSESLSSKKREPFTIQQVYRAMSDFVTFRAFGAKDKHPRTRGRLRDPNGGLTAAGRRYYKDKFGSSLRPGVMKKTNLTPTDMRRKGSWATRFYGRRELPPLKDARGLPTRFALSAAAWGEKVPRTKTEARAIARHGRFLLARYRRTKQR